MRVLDNAGALAMTEVPARLGVIGAGVIGLEMGSVWKRLGAEVTVLEAMPTFLAAVDEQIAKEAHKYLTKDTGLVIHNGVKIGAIENGADAVTVKYELNGQAQELVVDKLIVAIGRVPNTAGLNAEGVGLQIDERGFIVVDDHCHTNLPNVWAIGDVVRGRCWRTRPAMKAWPWPSALPGKKPHLDFNTIPWVIYTTRKSPGWARPSNSSRPTAWTTKRHVRLCRQRPRAGPGHDQGTVKVLACAKTDRILGVHIIGPMASELVAEAVAAMEFSASSEDIARIVHATRSLSEVVHEACLAADKRALHG